MIVDELFDLLEILGDRREHFMDFGFTAPRLDLAAHIAHVAHRTLGAQVGALVEVAVTDPHMILALELAYLVELLEQQPSLLESPFVDFGFGFLTGLTVW